ncbi:MAG: CAP domain-containing protein [Anaerolineae bacterium]|nr:CAP domain-containing protein [Anaerolineae bacterium]
MSATGTKSSLAILLVIAVAIANCGSATTYTVQPGDSLSGIAERYNTTFETLVEANADRYPSLKENPRLIKVGWELVIPQSGVSLPVVEAAGVTIQGAATATPFNTDALRQAIISATNEERAKHGLPALRVDATLMEVANRRARELAGSYSHYGPNGERMWEIEARQAGYPGQVGENIGKQPLTAGITGQDLIAGWMNSPAHRTNLLSDRFTAIGVGVYYAGQYQMLYRVQVFGTQ